MQGSSANADIREETCGHSGGRRGEDKLREKHGDIYMIASGNLLCAKGAQLCDKREAWSGVGGGRGIQEAGDVCVLVADSC